MRIYVPDNSAEEKFAIQADLAGHYITSVQANVDNPDLLLDEFVNLRFVDRNLNLVYQAPASLAIAATTTADVTWSDSGTNYEFGGASPALVIPLPPFVLEEGDVIVITQDLAATVVSGVVLVVE